MEEEARKQFLDEAEEEAVQGRIKDLQKTLATLEMIRKAIIKPFYRDYNDAVAELVHLQGTNKPFAHKGVGINIVEKKGQWVDFTPFEVKSTRIVEGPYDRNDFALKDAVAEGLEIVSPANLDYAVLWWALRACIPESWDVEEAR